QSEPLGIATFDLPLDRNRVHCLTHVLRGGEFDDLHQSQLDVHVDNGTMSRESECDVRVSLAGFRIDSFGWAVVVFIGSLDRCGTEQFRDRDDGFTGSDVHDRLVADREARGSTPGSLGGTTEHLTTDLSTCSLDSTRRHPGHSRG